MSRFLDNCLKQKVTFTLEMGDRPTKATFFHLQEVTYRISVFETFQSLYRAAKTMAYTNPIEHYKMFDSFVTFLVSERRYESQNPDIQSKRATAYNTMLSVVADYRKKYSSYVLKNPCDYIDDISSTMNAFLSVWLAHRNTYIEL